jgi:hypothetical protein
MWHYLCVTIIPCAALFSYLDIVFNTPSGLKTPISHLYKIRF